MSDIRRTLQILKTMVAMSRQNIRPDFNLPSIYIAGKL
jgi:hypothetical protein